MFRKALLIFLIIFIIFAFSFCTGKEDNTVNNNDNNVNNNDNDTDLEVIIPVEENSVAEANYIEAYSKWQQNNITSYTMKVNYGAFSPMDGLWDVVVENGQVVQLLFNGNEPTEAFKDNMSNLTMEYLFQIAQESYKNEVGATYLHYAEYDEEDGYVKIVAKIVNPTKKENVPTEGTFKYEVIELIPDDE
jgi:hypothetical protein